MKRLFDLLLAAFAAILFLFPIMFVAALVHLTSSGPILYWSNRVGRNNQIFSMPKFRSMRVGTPAVATHLLAVYCGAAAWMNYPSCGALSKAT